MTIRTPPFVWIDDGREHPEGVWNPPPAEHRDAIKTHVLSDAPGNSPCLWLDQETLKCKHYDQRPEICRDFVRGGEECLRVRNELEDVLRH